jgi:hypothetical protein
MLEYCNPIENLWFAKVRRSPDVRLAEELRTSQSMQDIFHVACPLFSPLQVSRSGVLDLPVVSYI